MYKSKLNVLSQKRKWAVPTYACIRTGEDHIPLFSASVMVHGISFNSPTACKSSKQAKNEVAELAYLHFTSESSNPSRGNVGKTNINEKEVKSSICPEDIAVNDSANLGKQNEFKKALQMYAQKKNLKLPVYQDQIDGIFFRAKVFINEGWFQSPSLCGTVEEAEDSAQAALLSLSTDAFLENDLQSYKILLQELAKGEGFFMPIYKTFGSDHDPKVEAFFSTVDVEGEIFKGDMAKSKKLAELNAAKAAYTALIERKLFQYSPSSLDVEKLAHHLSSVTISDPRENPISGYPSIISSSMKNETLAQGTTGTCLADENEEITDKKIYLLGKRFKVYKSIPNMPLPEGTVLLPISENMWTIVTLEFPGHLAITLLDKTY